MNISNCKILYNGDTIQEILYGGLPCGYSLMKMNIVYANGSLCTSVVFNCMNCGTWESLVNMYPDIFYTAHSTHESQDIVSVQETLLMDTPDDTHYYVLQRDGCIVSINDAIVFDSRHSTTYTLVMRSTQGGLQGGGSN